MATIFGTAGNDTWTIAQHASIVLDGLGGIDTLYIGLEPRSSFEITRDGDGAVHIDTLSGASMPSFYTLYNIEFIGFDNRRDVIDLRTYFGDIEPPVASFGAAGAPANGSVSFSLMFSEAVSGLAADDFTLNLGSVISVIGSGSNYTVGVALPSSSQGTLTLGLKAGAASDGSGNVNAEVNAVPVAFDTRAADSLQGTAGNDTLVVASAIKTVDGGAGTDTAALELPRASYRVQLAGSSAQVARADGSASVALANVERLKFADGSLAIDVADKAGQAAKTLGAVFGAEAVRNSAIVGVALTLLDGGIGYEGLMRLALDFRLGSAATSAQVVDLLFTNLVGRAPTAAERDPLAALIDSHAISAAGLGVLAAETGLNAINIDLVGLTGAGLPFTAG